MGNPCVIGRIGPQPFDEFWSAYPKQGRVGKKLAQARWAMAVDEVSERFGGDTGEAARFIVSRAAAYAASRVVRNGYAKHASTWLNQGCYDDDDAAWNRRPVADNLAPPAYPPPAYKPPPRAPLTDAERREVKAQIELFRRGPRRQKDGPA